MLRASFALFALLVGACGSTSSTSPAAAPAPSPESDASTSDAGNDDVSPDAGLVDGDAVGAEAAADASVDKSAPCVGAFGQAIGSVGFMRFDGTVVAVLAPGNKTCPAGNATHVVIEMQFTGLVYRMVVDVSDLASPGTIHTDTISHAMVGGPWSDGLHAVPLDYPTTFGLHSSAFTSVPTATAVAAITSALDLGAHVSVFATAQSEKDSAHLVHRQAPNQDGAIVVGVDSASPTWLLFSFSDQSF